METLIKIGISLCVFGLINFVVYAFCETFDIYSGRIWEKISYILMYYFIFLALVYVGYKFIEMLLYIW
jgi:hypothetical protein